MRYTLLSGAGNLFAVIDGFAEPPPSDPAALAIQICAGKERGGIEPKPDGLLLALRPTRGGDCAMVLYNADGSRPETCGNGLRCIAKLVVDRGHVSRERFVIESDAGPCAATVERGARGVERARIHMGRPRITARGVELDVDEARPTKRVSATLVDVGNPHCVLFVDDERSAPVTTLGPRLEHHVRFPAGTNVEFLALRDGGAFLRVWERGVGETQACGSGACAAALAAVDAGRASWPVRLVLPGGVLEVASDGAGGVLLSGPVEELAQGEWSPSRAGAERARVRPDGR